nr:hypothetical protein BaRGS_018772 [Batillaria attramentaria]
MFDDPDADPVAALSLCKALCDGLADLASLSTTSAISFLSAENFSAEIVDRILADFFLYLFTERHLRPVTIKGYRSCIARIYRLKGLPDPGSNPRLALRVYLARTRDCRKELDPLFLPPPGKKSSPQLLSSCVRKLLIA